MDVVGLPLDYQAEKIKDKLAEKVGQKGPLGRILTSEELVEATTGLSETQRQQYQLYLSFGDWRRIRQCPRAFLECLRLRSVFVRILKCSFLKRVFREKGPQWKAPKEAAI